MRTLHELPRFQDRWSYLYLEMGTLDQNASGLIFHNKQGDTPIPIDQLGLVMLGPGTSVTHAAIKALALNNCLLAWTGQEGVRLYAHSTGGTFSCAVSWPRPACTATRPSDWPWSIACTRNAFRARELAGKSIEQVRGMEGLRVRASVSRTSAPAFGVIWTGRNYDQDDWYDASPANRALSAANACLYGLCHAAILSAGYSAALGFIHTGKLLSFVYDVADFYKTEVTVPVAFEQAAAGTTKLERTVRLGCRKVFHETRLLERILPDIAEVLHVADDPAEAAEELEGRPVTLADRADAGGLPGPSEQTDPGGAVEEGGEENR